MDKVTFAIGMIVSHSIKNTEMKNHDGVIIGWHCKHSWTFVKTFMKRFSFPYKYFCANVKYEEIVDQPYYIILSENHQMCYVHQGIKRFVAFL